MRWLSCIRLLNKYICLAYVVSDVQIGMNANHVLVFADHLTQKCCYRCIPRFGVHAWQSQSPCLPIEVLAMVFGRCGNSATWRYVHEFCVLLLHQC